MPIYQVVDGRAKLKPVKTVDDFVELMLSAPIDIEALESELLTYDHQEDVPVIHRFYPGVYIRECRLSAGQFIIGHRHKMHDTNIMLSGRLTMIDGTELVAPMAFVGPPGRKACVIHEDVVWLNVYATDETDVGILEDMFLDKTPCATDKESEWSSEQSDSVIAARDDFGVMLADLGVDAEYVAYQSSRTDDRIPLPYGAYSFRSAPSPIHGTGIFATAPISPGDLIGPANVHGCRTILGHSVNHSGDPNAEMVLSPNGINLIAIKKITGSRGGRLGEEITVDYRQSRKAALLCQAG